MSTQSTPRMFPLKLSKKRSQKRSDRKEEIDSGRVEGVALQLEYLFEYGVNFRGRIITITDEINTRMFEIMDAALTELEAQSDEPITIRIHSPGGYNYDALAIVGRIKASNCQIITEGYGQIMSAATLILASGNLRRISAFSWFMWHEMSYNAEGRHSDVKDLVIQTEKEHLLWCKWMASFTSQDQTFWKKIGRKTDTYMSPEELQSIGVVDEIIGNGKTNPG